jgi:hypothetical protein
MSRRSTPERLYVARRTATLERLVSAGVLRDRADAALTAWEVKAADGAERPQEPDWEAAHREIRDHAS